MTRSSIFFAATAAALTLCFSSYAAVPDHKELSDTLSAIMESRTGLAHSKLQLKKILVRGGRSDFYFDSNLGGYRWDEASISGFKSTLHDLTGRKIGAVFAGRNTLEELVTPVAGNDGAARKYRFSSRKDPRGVNLVSRLDAPFFKKGLSGRHISLWNSHGRYYDNDNNVWVWQRPTFFGTVEDLFSYAFAFEYLAPMLENAGAYVLSPRERDTNRDEYVCDNDTAFSGQRDEGMRVEGTYREEGPWHSDAPGFSDSKPYYTIDDNPFTTGTTRYANCVGAQKPTASAEWSANVVKRGEYAVYVSYKSGPRSSSCAHYTVRHLGGTTEFAVDQRRSGSTWVYLGTFEFEGRAVVTLDNSTPAGYRSSRDMLVSADAVRIGGGMGKVKRGPSPDELSTSGLPTFAEGAIYPSVWGATLSPEAMKWEREYVQDYVLRGAWTTLMKEEKGVPVDLSLAFHTDAGIMGADSTVGTLAIYTLFCQGSRKFGDGTDRMCCRALSDIILTQITEDIRSEFNPTWGRRMVQDRSLSESRTTGVPGMLLEMLSHQNFEDMKYGLDPSFRFAASRAVYKGILKFLSLQYGCPYAVQPLPVKNFSATFDGHPGKVLLRWEPRPDPLEPTAVADRYLVRTRIDGGGFDKGVTVTDTSVTMDIEPGHVYSYEVTAVGEGGCSFPSEILSVGEAPGASRTVLIINGFDRVGGPAAMNGSEYAGFNYREDSGVPYRKTVCYAGPQYEFRRDAAFVNDVYPGFGACEDSYAGRIFAGNSFDYPSVHGKALLESGISFCSQSRDAYTAAPGEWEAIDLILGKQISDRRHTLFAPELKAALENHVSKGGLLVLSGSAIGSDPGARGWTDKALGYKMTDSHAGRDGLVKSSSGTSYEFSHTPNPDCYSVENADGIAPSGLKGRTILHYSLRGVSAAVRTRFHSGAVVTAFGFPLETLSDREFMKTLLSESLK